MINSTKLKNPTDILGFVDYCDSQLVVGWLADFANVDKQLQFKVFIDGKEVCTGIADQYRVDLANNLALKNTNHAYNLKIPTVFTDNQEHEVKVVESETGYVLEKSPLQVFFPKLENEQCIDLALVGKEGWLFLCNDSNDCIGQYTGQLKLSKDVINQYVNHYQTIQKFYRKKGIHYLLTVVPGKESIYSEFLPDSVVSSRDTTVRDQFILAINPELDVAILDLKQVLIANKYKGQLFFKNDSHWNYFGAMIACKAIITELRKKFFTLPEFNETSFTLIIDNEERCSLDLNKKNRLNYKKGVYSENTDSVEQTIAISAIAIQSNKSAIEIIEHPYQHLSKTRPTHLFKNKNKTNLPRAIVVRDSYTTWMIPFLTEYFSESLFVWARYVDNTVVESFKPDVIIEQVIDRFLIQNRIKQPENNMKQYPLNVSKNCNNQLLDSISDETTKIHNNFELIVHIGTGKTGSTSIQDSLIANQNWLQGNSVAYFGLRFEKTPDKYFTWQQKDSLHSLNDLESDERLLAQQEMLYVLMESIKKVSRQGIKRAIWSNESIFDTSDFVIPILEKLVENGIKLNIIVYIRRHDAWLRSAYIQWGIKHKTYLGDLQSFKEWSQNHLPHFASKLAVWLEQKKWSNVSVRNFDCCGDVVKDFFEYCGIYDHNLQIIKSNTTPTDVCLAAWAAYNGQFYKEVLPHDIEFLLGEAGLLNKPLRDYDINDLLPTQDDIDWVKSVTTDDRNALNAIFKQFSQPEIPMTPLTIQQKMVSQNQINAMLLFLIKNQADNIRRLETLLNEINMVK